MNLKEVNREQPENTDVLKETDVAIKVSPNPTLTKELLQNQAIDATTAGPTEYDEEQSKIKTIPQETVTADSYSPQHSRVDQVHEGELPQQAAQEFSDALKEVRMIPGVHLPDFEPSVVERYRFEVCCSSLNLTEIECTDCKKDKVKCRCRRKNPRYMTL